MDWRGMADIDITPSPPVALPALQPRRLQFLRLVTWYVYGWRLLRLQPSSFALVFIVWFLAAQVLAVLP